MKSYLLSLPERFLRSALGVSAGVARELGEVVLPPAVRRTRLYQNMVDATLRFVIEQVGRVVPGLVEQHITEPAADHHAQHAEEQQILDVPAGPAALRIRRLANPDGGQPQEEPKTNGSSILKKEPEAKLVPRTPAETEPADERPMLNGPKPARNAPTPAEADAET